MAFCANCGQPRQSGGAQFCAGGAAGKFSWACVQALCLDQTPNRAKRTSSHSARALPRPEYSAASGSGPGIPHERSFLLRRMRGRVTGARAATCWRVSSDPVPPASLPKNRMRHSLRRVAPSAAQHGRRKESAPQVRHAGWAQWHAPARHPHAHPGPLSASAGLRCTRAAMLRAKETNRDVQRKRGGRAGKAALCRMHRQHHRASNPQHGKPHHHAHAQALELPGALNRCYLGLGWASQPGAREIDLDASAALFSHGPAPKP